jgi:2-keto-myo-inositol isomerase
MSAPSKSVKDLLALASGLGCVGVEFRNDLSAEMFDRHSADDIKSLTSALDLRILALAEVNAFNDPDTDLQGNALALIKLASVCGSEGVALIPKVAQVEVSRDLQRDALKQSLIKLQPLLEAHGQVGLIEPLGFTSSTLRFKDDVVAVLDDLNRPACFRIIHDTFHHHIAQSDSIHAELTGLVHISGVTDAALKPHDLTDTHRVLVGQGDQLGNIAQLKALHSAGYTGPASFEAFAAEIHDMTDPTDALAGSIDFIASQMVGEPA